MSENNMGQVVPFRVNAARLRRSAEEYRRRGQQAEAMTLLRRAARQEDSPSDWLHLAEEYERLGCYEQAVQLLCRLLAREDAPLRTWLVLGFALAHQGMRDTAMDCMHHCINQDEYGELAEEVHSLSVLLETDSQQHERIRLPQLVRRSLRAWQSGCAALGERRMRRAIGMAVHPAPLMVQLAMLLSTENRMDAGLRCLASAVRREPGDAPALCTLALTMDIMDRPRLARGLLQRAMQVCRTTADEEMLITAACSMGAWGVCESFLAKRLQEQPCAIRLLQHQAEMCWAKHQPQLAENYWRLALQLEPDNLQIRSLLRWTEQHTPWEELPEGPLPQETMDAMQRTLTGMELRHPSAESLLDPDGEGWTLLNWALDYGDEDAQLRCLGLLGEDSPGVRGFLRQVLTHPSAKRQARERALLQLTQWGEKGPMYMLAGQRLTRVQHTPRKKEYAALWHMFSIRLMETGCWKRGPLLAMALKVWLGMTQKQRIQAAGPLREGWLQATEILYLRRSGKEQLAEKLLRQGKCPARRISHRLRTMERILDKGRKESKP